MKLTENIVGNFSQEEMKALQLFYQAHQKNPELLKNKIIPDLCDPYEKDIIENLFQTNGSSVERLDIKKTELESVILLMGAHDFNSSILDSIDKQRIPFVRLLLTMVDQIRGITGKNFGTNSSTINPMKSCLMAAYNNHNQQLLQIKKMIKGSSIKELDSDLNDYGTIRDLIIKQLNGELDSYIMHDLYVYLSDNNHFEIDLDIIFSEEDISLIRGMHMELLL